MVTQQGRTDTSDDDGEGSKEQPAGEVEARPAEPDQQPLWRRRLQRRRERTGMVPLIELLALVPVFAMLGAVLDGPKIQLPDYWIIAPETFNGDGSLAASTLFSYYNGHILALPKLLFWLNYKLNSGLNTTLGMWVVLMGVGQVLIMRALLPRGSRLGRWAASLLVVAIAVLVFAPQGTHNYVMSMSGASWVLANLLTVAAVWVVAKVRFWWAPVAAVPLAGLATVTYATGVMAWPALLVVAFLRAGWSRVHALLVALSVLAIGSYAWFYERPPAHGDTGLDLIDMSRRAAQVVGAVIAPDVDTAAALGVVAVVVAGFLAWRAVQLDRRATAPWVAILVYGLLGAAMIGVGRGGNDSAIGGEARYAPIAVMVLSAVVVLAVWLWPKDLRVSLAALIVVGLAFVGGREQLDHLDERNLRLEEVAIAARLDAARRFQPAPLYAPDAYAQASEYLRGFGHYPFSDAFDADCGMLDERLDAARVQGAAEDLGTIGVLGGFRQSYNADSVRMEGWVHSDQSVRCVLVIDGNRVVGAGVYGVPLRGVAQPRGFGTNEIGFVAVAPAGGETYRAVAVIGSDAELVLLPGELEGAEAPVPTSSQPTD